VSKVVVASIEENTIKVVHATLRGKGVTIERTEEVAGEEFDSYLQREKATEFIVSREFSEASYDVLTTPVLKPKYLKKYMESQIRKTTGVTDFTFVHSITGERTVDNRKMLEVYYYMVSNKKLREVLEVFHKNGKTVRALYPAVFSAASLLDPEASEEPKMGVIGTGNKRVVFSTKNGAVQFIRSFDSLESTFTNYDIQNMDMTIRYSIQNYGIRPSSATLLGSIAELNTADELPEVPLSSIRKTANIKCTIEVFNKYFLPIAALFAPKYSNILIDESKNLYLFNNLMAYASRAFIVLAVPCLIFMLFKAGPVMDKRVQVEKTSAAQSGVEALYADYVEKADVMNNIKAAVEFVNQPSSNLHLLMLDLTKISMKHVRIDAIDAQGNDGPSLNVSLRGKILVDTYSAFQWSFNRLIEVLQEMNDIQIDKKTVNFENKTFKVDVMYK